MLTCLLGHVLVCDVYEFDNFIWMHELPVVRYLWQFVVAGISSASFARSRDGPSLRPPNAQPLREQGEKPTHGTRLV